MQMAGMNFQTRSGVCD
ncbi:MULTISPECIES: DUF6783 domain-containing protein [Robinsoniella]|nr:DUF6783 domain-containing protein [Clostridiales bacterium]